MITAAPVEPVKVAPLLPGIHEGIKEAIYRAAEPRMSPSVLVHGLESMLHLQSAIAGELEDETADKKLGTDFHCRLLEPARFKSEYVAMPAFELDEDNKTNDGEKSTSKATKYYRLKAAEFISLNEKRTIIDAADMSAIERMAKHIYSHKVAKWFHAAGGCEVAVVGEIHGVPMKGKLDKLITKHMPLTIVDVKKIRKADQRTVENACRDYGYPFKAAVYVDLVEQHMREKPAFVWVFVEDSPPYDVFVMQMDDESYQIAQAEVASVISQMKHCTETGVWPGRCSEVWQGGYPDYYRKQAKQAGVMVE